MKKFKGVITALITPFKKGEVDEESIIKLVKDQINRGVSGFVINGTTAESPTVSKSECARIFNLVKALVPKELPLIVGVGTNCTKSTIENAREAEKLGADALLVVVPYYNKPPQRGLLEHFKAVASSVNVPVILYNVPGRTITTLELDTIKKLSEHPNIIGIKEASGNINFAKQIREICGKEFVLLSGDDGTYEEFLQVGGDGVISVASHIIPEAMNSGKLKAYKSLIDALFIEANPIPVKKALYDLNLINSPELRLPLVDLSTSAAIKLSEEMKRAGVVNGKN